MLCNAHSKRTFGSLYKERGSRGHVCDRRVSVTNMPPRPSLFVMIFHVRITTTFLSTRNSEVLFNENFSIAQTNRRRFTRRAAITRGRRNSSGVGTLRARDLPRVLYPCERTRQSRIDVRKCEHRGRQRGARHVTIRAVTSDRLLSDPTASLHRPDPPVPS